jgi:hypothetical protein
MYAENVGERIRRSGGKYGPAYFPQHEGMLTCLG